METYSEALEQAKSELENNLQMQCKLKETMERCKKELDALKNREGNLERTVASLGALVGEIDSKSSVGLTDAIRQVLSGASEGITAVEIRDLLREDDFAIDEYKQPLAVIHTTLRRLQNQEEVQGWEREGTNYFELINRQQMERAISDDEIPF